MPFDDTEDSLSFAEADVVDAALVPEHRAASELTRANRRIKKILALLETTFDASGAALLQTAVIMDITERKRADQSTARALLRLNEAQRMGQIGDWDLDLTTQTVTWSPQLFEIVGRDPALGPPRDAQEAGATFEPASQAIIADRVTQAIAVAVTDESGRPCRVRGTIQDISARKRAHAALQDREAKLQQAQRLAGLGSWYLELDSGLVRWSDETFRIFGLEPAPTAPSLTEHNTILTGASFATLTAAIATMVAEHDPFDVELEAIRPDQSGAGLSLAANRYRLSMAACAPFAAPRSTSRIARPRSWRSPASIRSSWR